MKSLDLFRKISQVNLIEAYSGRNGMYSTPFWPEWNDPFHSGRNGVVNPLHRRKKYATLPPKVWTLGFKKFGKRQMALATDKVPIGVGYEPVEV